MQKKHEAIRNDPRQAVRQVPRFALLLAIASGFVACDRKQSSEQKPQAMNKEEIKARIMEKDVKPSAEALARKE